LDIQNLISVIDQLLTIPYPITPRIVSLKGVGKSTFGKATLYPASPVEIMVFHCLSTIVASKTRNYPIRTGVTTHLFLRCLNDLIVVMNASICRLVRSVFLPLIVPYSLTWIPAISFDYQLWIPEVLDGCLVYICSSSLRQCSSTAFIFIILHHLLSSKQGENWLMVLDWLWYQLL
jgi:hypothetical protein